MAKEKRKRTKAWAIRSGSGWWASKPGGGVGGGLARTGRQVWRMSRRQALVLIKKHDLLFVTAVPAPPLRWTAEPAPRRPR